MGAAECCTAREHDPQELKAMRQSPEFRERWSDGARLPDGRYRCKFREEGQWKETVYTLRFIDDGMVKGSFHENVQKLVLRFPGAPVPAPMEFEQALRLELGELGVEHTHEASICLRYEPGALVAASERRATGGVIVEVRDKPEIAQALDKQVNGLSVMGFALGRKELAPLETITLSGAYNLWTGQVAWGEEYWWGSCEVLLLFGETLPGSHVELRGTFAAVFDDAAAQQAEASCLDTDDASCDPFQEASGTATGDLLLLSEAKYVPEKMNGKLGN